MLNISIISEMEIINKKPTETAKNTVSLLMIVMDKLCY